MKGIAILPGENPLSVEESELQEGRKTWCGGRFPTGVADTRRCMSGWVLRVEQGFLCR
jgi:hypothetical protein